MAEFKHANLPQALAAFQAELPQIIKENTAKVEGKEGKKGYTYGYADLADVAEAVLPKLGAHGLAFLTKPGLFSPTEGAPLIWALETQLMHESGDVESAIWPLTPNLSMQNKGGEITYSRRYSMMAFLGVFPRGEDDDGKAVTEAQGSYNQRASEWDQAKPAKPQQAPPPAQAAAEQKALENSIKRAQEKSAEKPAPTEVAGQKIINDVVERIEAATIDSLATAPVNPGEPPTPSPLVQAYLSLRNDFVQGTLGRAYKNEDGTLDAGRTPYAAWIDLLYEMANQARTPDGEGNGTWTKAEINTLWFAAKWTHVQDVPTESALSLKAVIDQAIDLFRDTQAKGKPA